MQAQDPQDPRPALLSQVNFLASRIEFSAAPIVLLCGGLVAEKERADDEDPSIQSLRHAIVKHETSYEVFRPEEITSWQADGIFKNLMDFEADLASICSLVVIILESPGSIAELGAFSQLRDLSKKIIAVKSSHFNDHNSFINLGILRHISKDHESGVKSFPWDISDPSTITSDIVEDLASDIQEELDKQQKTQVLKIDNNSHVMVVICELISLFVALKESEILGFLDNIGIKIKSDELKRKLFLLEKFRLIKRSVYSDATFYMSDSSDYHKIRLVAMPGENVDALRVPIECNDYYRKSSKHRSRVRAIRQASGVATHDQ